MNDTNDQLWTLLLKLSRTAIRLANWRRGELKLAQAEIRYLRARLVKAEKLHVGR